MAKKRKTVAELRNERAEADRKAWDEFKPRLANLQTYDEALTLVADSPPPDAPGRKYFSNLGFFLQQFGVPFGSSQAERLLYIQFIERLEAAKALKPGGAEKALKALEASVEVR